MLDLEVEEKCYDFAFSESRCAREEKASLSHDKIYIFMNRNVVAGHTRVATFYYDSHCRRITRCICHSGDFIISRLTFLLCASWRVLRDSYCARVACRKHHANDAEQ